MSVLEEVKRAYTEKTRNLNFRASKPVPASALSVTLKPIGRYNDFSPARVAKAVRTVDPKADVVVGREGSPVLYIRTTVAKRAAMILALRKVAADELGMVGRKGSKVKNWIRAWWN